MYVNFESQLVKKYFYYQTHPMDYILFSCAKRKILLFTIGAYRNFQNLVVILLLTLHN